MKKFLILTLTLVLLLVLAGCGGKTIAGSGTEADPYRIGTAAQLRQVASWINSKETHKDYYQAHYLITADIKMSGTWKPIGTYSVGFNGVLDGDGHTISGLKVSGSKRDTLAFIAYLNNGTVKNLTISDSTFTARGDNSANVAAVVNKCFKGTIENCHTTGSVTVKGNGQTAGICAQQNSDSLLTDCTNAATVTAKSAVGNASGIVAYTSSPIINCSNSGTISSDADAAGIACNAGGGLSGCTNTGTITAGKGYAAGIVCSFGDGALNSSENNASVTLENCENSGSVTSKEEIAGGIAASCCTGILRNCVNSGAINGAQYSGGIFAYFQPSAFGTAAEVFTVSGCSNSGSVTVTAASGNEPVGGICGQIYGGSNTAFLFENCTNTGTILTSGQKNVAGNHGSAGGLIGSCRVKILELVSCSNSGSVTGVREAGGLIGSMTVVDVDNREGTLFLAENCENSGDVYVANAGGLTSELDAGGMVGSNGTYRSSEAGWVSFETETFTGCTNTGTLSGDTDGPALRVHETCGTYMSDLK